MKNKKLLLVCLSLVLLFAFASCDMLHDCSIDAIWESDETHHWRTCGCGKDYEGEHTFGEWQENADGARERACTVCGYVELEVVIEHEHNYSTEWSKDEDNHWHACSGCDLPSDKGEHDWDDGVVATDPTCSANGTKTLTCKTCKATKDVEIEKLPHTEEILAAKDATCLETGLTEGKKCSVCGETILAQEVIEAKGHDYKEEWSRDENNHWQVCDICGESSDPVAHSYDSGTVTEGKVVYTCVCGVTTENAWDGTTVSESLAGSGTEADPYLIQSGADLAYLDRNATATENFSGVYFKMTRSIDLNGHSVKIGEYPGWGGRKIFLGIFDGNGCSIINLNMTESGMGGGLFAVVSGTVKNLSVYGTVKGDDFMTGGIVGWLFNGTLENCVGYVNVTSTGASETGALVGTSEGGRIINCTNYGSVIGVDSVGGIAGKASGTIENCVNNGTVFGCSGVGGIYGSQHHSGMPTLTNNTDNGTAEIKHVLTHHEAKVNTCEEAGNVEYYACSGCKKNFDAEGNVLGAVELAAKGHAWDNGVAVEDKITFTCGNCGETRVEDAKYTVTVNHLFLDGSVAAEAETIEFAYKEMATVNAKAIEGYVANNDYVKVEMLASVVVNIYYSQVDVWDGTSVSESLTGSGTEADPYLVQSGADLAYIDQHMTANENFKGVYFKLTKSIDLGGRSVKIGAYPGWGGRVIFCGIFDGNNCSIRNLNMTESGMGAGLFSVVSGTVKNLSVYGSVKGDGNMTGGIVGWLFNGTLENCNGYVNVTSTGASETGALVGTSQSGTIIGCTNYGSVEGIDGVGGIAGKASKTIESSKNFGSVIGCTNANAIYGAAHSSGTPTVTNCVNYGTVSIHKLTHHDAKANTCEEAGNIEHYSCSICKGNFDAEGNALGEVVLEAKGHAWDDGVSADGKITFTCGNCGETRVEDAKYTVTVNHLFLDGSVATEAEAIEFVYNELATVNAKTIEGYVANNDYVKVKILGNTTVTIYYSEISEAWDGTSVTESLSALGGSGTAEDPYIIDSGADLALIDQSMTAIGDNYSGVYFKMTKSIDLGGHPINIGAYTTGWNNDRRFFTGTFDGNNCSVRNLGLDMTSSGHMGGGLFAVVKGTVKNLSVYGTVKSANKMSAGVVGWLYGGTLENCTNYVKVTSTAAESGAVVGTSEKGTIKNCVNYGSIVGTESVGAIAGKASGTISGCKNYGTYEGTSQVGEIYGSAHSSGTPTVTD